MPNPPTNQSMEEQQRRFAAIVAKQEARLLAMRKEAEGDDTYFERKVEEGKKKLAAKAEARLAAASPEEQEAILQRKQAAKEKIAKIKESVGTPESNARIAKVEAAKLKRLGRDTPQGELRYQQILNEERIKVGVPPRPIKKKLLALVEGSQVAADATPTAATPQQPTTPQQPIATAAPAQPIPQQPTSPSTVAPQANSYASHFHTPAPTKNFAATQPAPTVTTTLTADQKPIIAMAKEAKTRGWTAAMLAPSIIVGAVPKFLRGFAMAIFKKLGMPVVELDAAQHKAMTSAPGILSSSPSNSPNVFQANSLDSKNPIYVAQSGQGTNITCTQFTESSIKEMADAAAKMKSQSVTLPAALPADLRATAAQVFQKAGITCNDPLAAQTATSPQANQTSLITPTQKS